MAEIIEIKSYQYYDFASRDFGSKTVVICKGAAGQTINLHFIESQGDLPATRKINDTKFLLYYRYSDKSSIIDMLRNESPIYLIYVPEGMNNTRLSTGSEPVGEGEET